MTTTVMRDSIVGDNWIYQTCMQVPIAPVMDQETGQPTGDFVTGPVRLAFPDLFVLPKPSSDNENPKYGAALLFSPWADFTPLTNEMYALYGREFSEYYDAASGTYYGLHSPFHDQGEKAKMGGFTPGLQYFNSTSGFKPPVVDLHNNPIVDQSRVYPGVWAICGVRPYTFKDKRKKGVGFGLQSVMIIGDDTRLGGGPVDPSKTFGGIGGAISAPPVGQGQVAGMPSGQPPAGPPQTAPMGAPPAGGTMAPPPVGAGAPAPAPAPAAPAYTPPPAADPRGPVPDGYTSWAEYDDIMG